MKICKRYLIHIQNSVFEGNLTEKKLNELKAQFAKVIIKELDSIMIYKMGSIKYIRKDCIGNTTVISDII